MVLLFDSKFLDLDLVPGAGGFQMSNASPFSAAGVIASLEVSHLSIRDS